MRLKIFFIVLLAGLAAADLPTRSPAPLSPAPSGGGSVEKWNSYVDLAHELEALFLPALNAYLETFGHNPEYSPIEGSGLIANYFLVLMESPEELNRVLDQARSPAGRPEGELDQAVRELMPYLEALWSDLKRSRDFHLSEGKDSARLPEETGELRVRLDSPEELHARIFTAYQGFAATYERFRGTLNRAGQERRQNDIRILRERGLLVHSALLEILDAGQGLQDYLNVRRISGAPLAGLKPEDLEPFLDRLESGAGILEKLTTMEGSVIEGLSVEALIEFFEQLQVVMGEARILAGPEEGGSRTGPPETLGRALGRLVDIYNLME